MRTNQELNSLALKTRKEWGEDAYSPIDIFAIVNRLKEKKITLVSFPLSSNISGMCTKENEDNIIVINSTTSYGRQRFTLAHELYHVLYEENNLRVICDMNMSDNKSESEREADIFAGYLIMPYDALFQFEDDRSQWDLDRIIEVEQFFQISHQAMLYRLTTERLISAGDAEKYKSIKISAEAAKRGYGKELYFKSNPDNRYFTTGEYIRKVEALSEKGLISAGKQEELLMDAFRADIVYNYYEGEDVLND